MDQPINIDVAQLEDQGKLGPLLIKCLGEVLADENDRAKKTGQDASSAEDELMAADDWYFSSVDLMNGVHLAWDGEKPVGASVINPYTAELHYLVVLPEYRRQGIGTKLFNSSLAELEYRGVSHLKIDVPLDSRLPGATEFFSSLGFTELRRRVLMGRKV